MEINISCRECRQCNRKGKPSVMRGSAYCDSHRKYYTHKRKGLFGWISKKFFSKVKDRTYNKRIEYNDDGSVKEFNKKGFRESWFFI